MFDYAQKIYEDYSGAPAFSFVLGTDAVLGAEKVNLRQLLDKLYELISDEVV